jgi:hypothetical protein
MNKVSNFRTWVNELYYENCKEREAFKEPCFKSEDYFNKYKWWLKREFQHQQSKKM